MIHDARIELTLPSQEDLREHSEHCSADPRLLAALGARLGGQLRLRRTGGRDALFTVSEVREEDRPEIVRAGLIGRRRLGTDEPSDGVASTPAADPKLSECQAEDRDELVERLDDDDVTRRGLVVIAPHGGDIESHTDDQAERVAKCLSAAGVTLWRCKGWGDAFDRWHITSVDLDPASFPLLGSLMDRRFRNAVAFHGFRNDEVLIGGTASPALKRRVRDAIADAVEGIVVRVARPDDRFGGDNPCNIVNRLTAGWRGGVQIEQGLTIRRQHGDVIAAAVAGVYARRLRHPLTVTAFPGHAGRS